jgi:hypothetical protein
MRAEQQQFRAVWAPAWQTLPEAEREAVLAPV